MIIFNVRHFDKNQERGLYDKDRILFEIDFSLGITIRRDIFTFLPTWGTIP